MKKKLVSLIDSEGWGGVFLFDEAIGSGDVDGVDDVFFRGVEGEGIDELHDRIIIECVYLKVWITKN